MRPSGALPSPKCVCVRINQHDIAGNSPRHGAKILVLIAWAELSPMVELHPAFVLSRPQPIVPIRNTHFEMPFAVSPLKALLTPQAICWANK